MRLIVPCIVAAIALAGCSAAGSQAGPESSTAPTALPSMGLSAPPSASAVPTGSASGDTSVKVAAPPLPSGSDWKLVSAGLERSGAQAALDAAALGKTMVAGVLTEDTPDDYDAGIVYSNDSGSTWQWGGVIADPGRTFPEAVLLEPDQGASWRKQVLSVPGATEAVVKQLAIAPDGSWNAVGQVSTGDLISQYDMLWLTSNDKGRTFSQIGKTALTAPFDQGAQRIAFSADGSAAIMGWTEVSEDHGSDAALWVTAPGHDITQIGTAGVPVSGSNPSGDFLDGILWNHETLVAWGSADGSYPMDEAQFWNLAGAELTPAATLPGNGTPLDVTTILDDGGSLTGVGFTGEDLNQTDVGVWRGAIVAPASASAAPSN